ncbi:hypothetical protein HK100_012563 [Physocladia obscura]|uniref:Uncharacterized protein n=1 Tax=Physocladia obscura TaxID=109957 RepID=A0AAD5T0K0_9FUNG|nr:hypothetical protein HK100_012563 [Physocladia obscura]
MSDTNSTHSEDRSRKFSLKSIFQGKDKDKAKSRSSSAHKEKTDSLSSTLILKNIPAQPAPSSSSVRVHSPVLPAISQEISNPAPGQPEPKEPKPGISAFNTSVASTTVTIPSATEGQTSESSKSKSTNSGIKTSETPSPVESVSKAVFVASAIAIVVFVTFRLWSK